MSKRITLTDREIQYITKALIALKEESLVSYQVVKTGRQVYQDIIDKLNKKEEDHE